MKDLLDRFIGQQQIRQYGFSRQWDIGQNLSSTNSTLKNRKGMRSFGSASKSRKRVAW